MTDEAKYPTREQWLTAAVAEARTWIEQEGDVEVPAVVHVSTGWTSFGAGRKAIPKALAECDPRTADGNHTIHIAPHTADAFAVFSSLLHELCHACMPIGTGHKGPFKALGKRIGLVGKPTSMDLPGNNYNPPDESAPAVVWARQALVRLGPYPHSPIVLEAAARGKQGTRMLKAECPGCAYTCRLTRKWVDLYGAPLCPNRECVGYAEPMLMPDAEPDEEPEDE